MDIVGVGLATVDYLGVVPYVPKPGSSVNMKKFKEQCGGPASTALIAAAKMGAYTSYVGIVGGDNNGNLIKQSFMDFNVDVSELTLEKGKASTIIFVVVHEKSGERTFYGCNSNVSRIDFNADKESLIASAKYLHLDATNFDEAYEAADIARKHQVKISLDGCVVNKRTNELIKLTDVLITNETYPEEVTGFNDPRKALLTLKRMGPEIVVSTMGVRGCLVVEGDDIVHYDAYNVEAVDTTGAGDVFHGAFLYGLIQGWNIKDLISFASATSAINCLTVGGRKGLPDINEVLNFIDEHGKLKVINKK
jgi:sulfofructose kinase